jgi:hypothetical protein
MADLLMKGNQHSDESAEPFAADPVVETVTDPKEE